MLGQHPDGQTLLVVESAARRFIPWIARWVAGCSRLVNSILQHLINLLGWPIDVTCRRSAYEEGFPCSQRAAQP